MRLLPMMFKVATAWQFVDGELHDVVYKEWIEKAWSIIPWTMRPMREVYASANVGFDGEATARVLRYYKKHKSASELECRRVVRNTVGATRVHTAIKALIEEGDLKESRRSPSKGVLIEYVPNGTGRKS